MKPKPSAMFMVSALVAVLLIAGAAVLLWTSTRKVHAVQMQVKRQRAQLSEGYRLEPFPSQANVQRENENAEKLAHWYDVLVKRAGRGQLQLDERRPPAFMTLLGATRRELIELGRSNAVQRGAAIIADGFGFGFDRYFGEGGKLPAPEHVPRLTEQLKVVDSLVRIFVAERVSAVGRVEREVFEGTPQGEGEKAERLVNPNAGLMAEGGLYGRFHFRVELLATESALLGVLNQLARHELFMVPTRLTCTKQADDVLPADAVQQAAMAVVGADLLPNETLTREQRMVSGLAVEKPMIVALELDVYSFRGAKP